MDVRDNQKLPLILYTLTFMPITYKITCDLLQKVHILIKRNSEIFLSQEFDCWQNINIDKKDFLPVTHQHEIYNRQTNNSK